MATAAEISVLEGRLALYLQAEADVLRNQSYEMPNGRKLTRANLSEIRKGMAEVRAELAAASGVVPVRGRVRRGVIMS